MALQFPCKAPHNAYFLLALPILNLLASTLNAVNQSIQLHLMCQYQERKYLYSFCYTYDAWGKPISTDGSMAGTLGYDNPFRYRGYVWDEETGLYYLRSRYYDPSWGSFINADGEIRTEVSLFDAKLFCYCRNNPIRYVDDAGTSFWDVLKEIATVVLAVAVVVVVVAVVAGTGGGAGFALAGGGALAGAATAATEAAVVTAAAATTVYGAAALGQTIFLASSAGKMQRDVERGRAPREVDRVDDPHPGAPESHVHFKDGTALNQSGTLHDKMKGVPKLPKPLIKWLGSHDWATKIRFK